jgi:hypothetical protein
MHQRAQVHVLVRRELGHSVSNRLCIGPRGDVAPTGPLRFTQEVPKSILGGDHGRAVFSLCVVKLVT